MNKKMIRIKDIAKLAGVSVGTVDRVIHNRGKVSEKAREKVEKVLQEIDYTPNLLAKTLGSNKVYTIALLVPDPSQDPYWKLSMTGLDTAQEEWRPYHMELQPCFFELENAKSFTSAAQRLLKNVPDAVVSAPIFLNEAIDFFKKLDQLGTPYVHFNTMISTVSPLSFIGQDSYQSGRLGASLLHLASKHQKGKVAILHIRESVQHSVHFREKERGFRDFYGAMHPAQSVEAVIIEGNQMDTFEEKLISAIKKNDMKGLFIPTSSGAKLTADVLEKNGLDHISIVGYDLLNENINLLKSGYIDFLIHQNPSRQVFRGIHHLANHLLFKKTAPEKELFPLEVITAENIDSYLEAVLH
ncbi:LacI family DNA-binding transcriptional regulator [Echinicola rosea]|uniref:Transcriptional regulator n=1 Tax=Echinicola rosea TaxID=1807691 RepID=A0ABQ1UYL2_9BACT|nr:substrate-binding domain-containing protein [Echinicola rosea]GGF29434.1 transcriptional regulator [Echinicola rosea]